MRGMISVLVLLGFALPAGAAAQPPEACTAPSECVLTHRSCCGACGGAQRGDAMAVRPERLRSGPHPGCVEALGECPACEAPDDADLAATCSAGRCEVLYLAATPMVGTLAGCTITQHTTEVWASWMWPTPPVTDADGITPYGASITVHIECGAAASVGRLHVIGWITAAGATAYVPSSRAVEQRTGAIADLAIGPGITADVNIVVSDGRILSGGTEVRAVLRWSMGDGTSIELGAPPGPVRIAS